MKNARSKLTHKNSKIAISTKNCFNGRWAVCARLPCISLQKKREFQTFIFFFSLQKNSSKLHIFAKFGMANLFRDPIFHQN